MVQPRVPPRQAGRRAEAAHLILSDFPLPVGRMTPPRGFLSARPEKSVTSDPQIEIVIPMTHHGGNWRLGQISSHGQSDHTMPDNAVLRHRSIVREERVEREKAGPRLHQLNARLSGLLKLSNGLTPISPISPPLPLMGRRHHRTLPLRFPLACLSCSTNMASHSG